MQLVMGASGFLGSHVTRELVARGEQVRVMLRESSSTRAIDDLDVERCYGELTDADAVRAAMAGCEVVYYCVVDARAWLRDPAPLFRTNVEGLRAVLDVAVDAGLKRFVFTSSMGTIAVGPGVDESTPHNWLAAGGDYIRSRKQAEDLVLDYSRERGLPGVALCIANTYGPGDHLPTPHGLAVALAARGTMPVYFAGAAAPVVDVRDAAIALVLAADRGTLGERYIVASEFVTNRRLQDLAADCAGVSRPRVGIPRAMLSVIGRLGDLVAKVARRDVRMTSTSATLLHIWTPLEATKARTELGWRPRPIEETIHDAVEFFTAAG